MTRMITDFLHWFATRLAPYLDALKSADLRASLAYCGKDVRIRMPTVIESPENVQLMDGVTIGSFVHFWGDGTIVIGENTMIGSHVAITSATHDVNIEPMNTSVVAKPVRIGRGVWIGTHAVILPGVTVGDHSVVAAGAVVREDVAPYAIVAGIPAVLIRSRKIVALKS
jgi:acetyltransferase-like isoleucine patch superfamily enzyme